MIFGPNSVETIDISTGNIIEKGVSNHSSKAYEFSHFLLFLDLLHSQLPLERGGKNILSTPFAVSTSISESEAEPVVSIYEIEIQGDSNPNLVPTPKRAARKMTRNPSDTQRTKDQFQKRTLRYVMQTHLLQRDAINSM